MRVYYRIFPFDNSGSYESLLKDISSITQAHMTVYYKDISSITQAHMTVYCRIFHSITQAHMTVY